MAATAKIFMHGRSQAVRLPKEFRLPGKEVRVSKVGDKVILEPIEQAPFDVKAWRAKLDAVGARDVSARGPTRRRAGLSATTTFRSTERNVLSRHECRHFRDQRAAAKNR